MIKLIDGLLTQSSIARSHSSGVDSGIRGRASLSAEDSVICRKVSSLHR